MRIDDDAALHAFVEGRRTALFRSAYLLCGDRHEAEDLVQSTLVKVVLGGRRYGRLDNIEAYARKTLVNTFIAARRPPPAAASGGASRRTAYCPTARATRPTRTPALRCGRPSPGSRPNSVPCWCCATGRT